MLTSPRTSPSQAFIRSLNTDVVSPSERALLELLRQGKYATRAELTHASNMAPQSTARLIDALVERGFLRLGERVRHGRGQPSVRIDIVPEAALSIGVSIMSDAIGVGLMNLAGAMIDRIVVTDLPMTLEAIVACVRRECERMLHAGAHDPARLLGLGIACTGNFTGTRAQLATPHWLADLAGRDLDLHFEAAFGLPTIVENDGTAAAIGESLVGVGRTTNTFGYIYFGAGLGGGVVIDGQPIRGAHGNAGEFSRVIPMRELQDRPTLESLRVLLERNGIALTGVAELEARFDLAWPGVEAWVERARRPLLDIVAAITAVADPPAIVFGGRLPRALGDRLVEALEPDMNTELSRSAPLPRLMSAMATPDSALQGAAALPFRKYFY